MAIPNLLRWDGPAIAIDVKGELYRTTADYRRDDLGQQVVLLDPWHSISKHPDTLNPLDPLGREGVELADDAMTVASLVTAGPSGSHSLKEPFWEERAASLIAGLLACRSLKGDTLAGVYDLLHDDDIAYQLAVMLDTRKDDMDAFGFKQVSAHLQTTEVTRSGILSTAQNAIRLYGTGPMKAATDRTSFDVEAVARGDPMTIYIVVPAARLRSHGGLIRLWANALTSLVTSRQARPEKPTLFVLDELAQLGTMPQVVQAITLGRSYGMRCLLFLQSLAQLRAAYPDDHRAIIENCESIATFGHVSRSMSDQLAAELGDVTGEALFNLRPTELAVRCSGRETRIARKLDYLTDAYFAGRFRPNPMFGRER